MVPDGDKTMNDAMKNYRTDILEICNNMGPNGRDWEQSLLAGSPDFIDRAEAAEIARWLAVRADIEWGKDGRHFEIARRINDLVNS